MFESLRTQGTFDRSQQSLTVLAALCLSSRLADRHEIPSTSGEQVASLCQSILCFPGGASPSGYQEYWPWTWDLFGS